ncbi:hypothetical protein BV898_16679 [Hypsibius exemplaris]|uniref:Uncharacterized protein n=1 Tax=Hypsibius exemplaris TaxID=2072580 RepID=A0A9X6RM26_HYPEX|nr:hypothetical protein BV898_16679 [Hypsibius exemplaris]
MYSHFLQTSGQYGERRRQPALVMLDTNDGGGSGYGYYPPQGTVMAEQSNNMIQACEGAGNEFSSGNTTGLKAFSQQDAIRGKSNQESGENRATPSSDGNHAPRTAAAVERSYCEHGYPVSSPSQEEVPFVTVRKCKRGRNKAQVPLQSSGQSQPRPTERRHHHQHNRDHRPTAEDFNRPTVSQQKCQTLPRRAADIPRPVSTYGIRKTPPGTLRTQTTDSGSSGSHAGPNGAESGENTISHPPQSSQQGGGGIFQTREWRPSPKKSPPMNVQTQVSSSPSSSLVVQAAVSVPAISSEQPVVAKSSEIPTDGANNGEQAAEGARKAAVCIKTMDKRNGKALTTALPTAPQHLQKSDKENRAAVVINQKVIHGKAGLIEVPAALKAVVFGASAARATPATLLTKSGTTTTAATDRSNSEKPKPVKEHPQSRCANRKAGKLLTQQSKPAPEAVSDVTDNNGRPLLPTSIALEKIADKAAEQPVGINEVAGDDPVMGPEILQWAPHHLLETAWTLYHMNGATRRKGVDWNAGIEVIGVFDTVESFFLGFNSTPKASETAKNQDYMFFRGGKGETKSTPIIRAAWEDEKNTKGGMWRFSVPMRSRGGGKSSDAVDFFWKEILMALIGEQFGQHNDFVNGCYFCNRADEYRLQVWMGCDDAIPVTAVGLRLVELLELRGDVYFDFCSHEEINKKGNRYAKPLHDHQDIFSMLSADLK